jgi:hypothetical protein
VYQAQYLSRWFNHHQVPRHIPSPHCTISSPIRINLHLRRLPINLFHKERALPPHLGTARTLLKRFRRINSTRVLLLSFNNRHHGHNRVA